MGRLPDPGAGRRGTGKHVVIDENSHPWQTALGTLARAVGNEINLRGSLTRVRESLLVSETLVRSLQDSLLARYTLRPTPCSTSGPPPCSSG